MSDERIVASSGNVFADLGLPDADEAARRPTSRARSCDTDQHQNWTQAQAAQALDIDQPKVSALMRGRLTNFSTDRLIRFLNNLEQEVEITVRPKAPGAHGASRHCSGHRTRRNQGAHRG